jgi:hypothetical protein
MEEEEEYNPFVFDLNELREVGVNADTVRRQCSPERPDNSPPTNEGNVENVAIITEQKIIPENVQHILNAEERPGPSTGRPAGDFKLFSQPIKNAHFLL